MTKGLTYQDAGVDIHAAGELEDSYFARMRKTFTTGVMANDGGFGGLFRLFAERKYQDPVLVSGTDGVGTKLKIAFATGKHDSVGIDLVAMSVNDILVQGATPLFFLDYIAIGRVDPTILQAVIDGVSTGCEQAKCALIGGETAELPGFYATDEYDLAGFAVGVVERKDLVSSQNVSSGDAIIGLFSSGLHSNGFSLARKALLEVGALRLEDPLPGYSQTLAEVLLTPTKIYVDAVLPLLEAGVEQRPIKAMAHITGGGIIDNLPRVLPEGLGAQIDLKTWTRPKIFDLIQHCGKIDELEMRQVFNLGLGFILVVNPERVAEVMSQLAKTSTPAAVVGQIIACEQPDQQVKFIN